MLLRLPGGMGRRVMDTQIKRGIPLPQLFQILQRLVRNHIRYILIFIGKMTVFKGISMKIPAASRPDGKPPGKSLFPAGIVTQMPFSA